MTDRCADASAERGEPLLATASRVERWLLVEHRGAWGPQAPPTSRLRRPIAQHLAVLAQQHSARLLMVRRPRSRTAPGRWVFAVTSSVGRERVLALHLDDDEQLLDVQLDFDGAAPSGWKVREDRLWLVCTHGRHDLCCAVAGRPVADAMLAAEPDSVWEASHLGGDRFAPNLVLLPEGHYFGRVTPEQAPSLMAGIRQGRLDLGTWRGRSSLPLPVQAAQSFARTATGQQGLQELSLLEQVAEGPDQWRVRLTGGSRWRSGTCGRALLPC